MKEFLKDVTSREKLRVTKFSVSINGYKENLKNVSGGDINIDIDSDIDGQNDPYILFLQISYFSSKFSCC